MVCGGVWWCVVVCGGVLWCVVVCGSNFLLIFNNYDTNLGLENVFVNGTKDVLLKEEEEGGE